MFDTTQPLKTKIPIGGKMEVVSLRFPTDQEWLEYHRTRRVIDQNLGRGKSETSVERAADAATTLFQKISDQQIPPAAAELVINKLARVETVSAVSEDGGYRVAVEFFGGQQASHLLRMPSAEHLKRSDAATRVIGDGKRAEYRIDLSAFAQMYQELVISAEGYSGPVPLFHKQTAVAGAIKAVRDEMEDDGDFF